VPGHYEEGRGAGFVASGAEDGMVPWAFGRQNAAWMFHQKLND